MSVQHPLILPNLTTLLEVSLGQKLPLLAGGVTVGGVEGFRKVLEGEGISKLAATLITNSRSES